MTNPPIWGLGINDRFCNEINIFLELSVGDTILAVQPPDHRGFHRIWGKLFL
jgi:hypothetical protein